LHGLWFDRELTRNTGASLRRVLLGFGLAALVGVPIGIICGCFYWVGALFAPFTIFGRNVPIAALIPLTFAFFGIGEEQKVMFIFLASIAFIIADSANAAHAVNDRYLDTAVTLGASRWQTVRKVVVPLAMPSIFNSLRLLFGLAFGYIMLSEVVNFGDEAGGLGHIINMSRRIGPREHILLILMIIPLVALVIDRILYAIQRSLFPSQYGGSGILHDAWRTVGYWMEDAKLLVFGRKSLDDAQRAALAKQQPPDAVGH
jgi:NitT/TauT family transport system permease protein